MSQEEKSLKLKKISEKYGIKLVMLFGSFAAGTQKPDSDYDVAILGNYQAIKKNEVDIIKDISLALEKDIDLSIMNQSDPLLKFQVAKNSRLLFGSARDYLRFRVQATLENMDNRFFYNLEAGYLKEKYG